MLGAVLTSLGLVFLAEVADKTMLVTLSYAIETKRYVRILLVSTLAFTVASILSVGAGYLTRFYVDQKLLNIIAGMLLFVIGVLLYSGMGGHRAIASGSVCTYFLAVLVCEMGDKTQLAMFSSSAIHGEPVLTLLGGAIGYAVANGLGILLVALLSRFNNLLRIKKFIALLMVIIGVLMVLRAVLEVLY